MTMRALHLLALGAALSGASCGEHAVEEPAPAAVETAEVRPYTRATGVRYAATVAPETQVSLAFRIGGYVVAVNADEGDRVQKGQVLARLRPGDYQSKVEQAAGGQAEAEASLEQARKDLERVKTLFAQDSATQPELDAAQARFDATQARVGAQRAVAREAGIALGDTALVAPLTGVVLSRRIEPGDLASPGAPAFVVADTRRVKVELGVPDVMIRALRVGDPIEVTTESLSDRVFTGRISRIAPAADAKSREFGVEIRIANPEQALKPGMIAALEIARGEERPSLAVPLAAVVRPPGASEGYAVFVLHQERDGAVVRARRVELGDPVGNLVKVRGGLQGGETIVVSGPSLLSEGQRVQVVGAMR
jgi:membrane fusion protein, multidrug efflux system